MGVIQREKLVMVLRRVDGISDKYHQLADVTLGAISRREIPGVVFCKEDERVVPLSVLKVVESAAVWGPDNDWCCPVCRAWQEDEKQNVIHEPDCELGRAIKGGG